MTREESVERMEHRKRLALSRMAGAATMLIELKDCQDSHPSAYATFKKIGEVDKAWADLRASLAELRAGAYLEPFDDPTDQPKEQP